MNAFLESLLSSFGINPDALFWSNSLADYTEAAIWFVALFATLGIFQRVVLFKLSRLAEKTKTNIDDTLIAIVKSIRPPFYAFLALYIASRALVLSGIIRDVLDGVLIIWAVYQATRAVQILINHLVEKQAEKDKDPTSKSALSVLGTIVKVALWSVAALLVLSNLGVNITSLVAGLGIGGIAVAFALQNILNDLFSSFAIYFDKPFRVGDFIVVGDKTGVVEKIGIKTTRLRALQGEEVIISNRELTSVHVQNFKRMKERRIQFTFGVTYETPNEKLKKIPETVRRIFDEHKDARLDRAHLKEFADSSLNFEVVYYVLSNDFGVYMNVQQDVNLKLKEAFEKENIVFAYPTQTLYLNKT